MARHSSWPIVSTHHLRPCSRCRSVKAKLSPDERMFQCEACGLTIDRDVNAAINLARQGLAGTNSATGRGGKVRPQQQLHGATAHPSEASTETHLQLARRRYPVSERG